MTNGLMASSLDQAEVLMRLQAMINSEMRDLNVELSSRSEIKSTIRECTVDRYERQDRTSFSVSVDVETNRDIAVSFGCEFFCESTQWCVEALIAQRFREGQHTLEEYPMAFPANAEELEVATRKAVSWLTGRAKMFNFNGLEKTEAR